MSRTDCMVRHGQSAVQPRPGRKEYRVMKRLLLRPNEAADLLAVGRSKLYELIAAGEVPSMKIGKSLRVPAAALEQWVAEHAASAVEDAATPATTAETLAGQRR